MAQTRLINNKNNALSYRVLLFFALAITLPLSGCSLPIIAVRTSNNGANKENDDFPPNFIKDKSICAMANKVGEKFKLKIDKSLYFGGGGWRCCESKWKYAISVF